MLILGLSPIYLTFLIYGGHLVHRALASPNRGYLFFAFSVVWLLGPIVLFMATMALKQLILDRARAIWIDRGQLIFVNKWIFAVPTSEIASVNIGVETATLWVKQPAIVLRLRGGDQKTFPTGSLSERPATIVARLNEVLGLTTMPTETV